MDRPTTTPLPLPLSDQARRTEDSPINALIAAKMANPDLINLAAGLVDEQTLPVGECRAIAQKILSDPRRGRRALQYGTTIGLRPLRQALLAHLEKLEGRPAASMNLTADDILVSTGSQQALYLIAEALLDPGDIVITANPSYFVFTGALASLGADVRAVPMDGDGMDVGAAAGLIEGLEREGVLPRVKFFYTPSYFDNPTGLSLSESRRLELYELAGRASERAGHRVLVLEDAAYRELRYDGPALPSIKSFDPENAYTILTQTFSKPFAPGIKLGYTAMPGDLLDQVLRQKGSHDFGSANLTQEIALEAMTDGSYGTHLEELKAHYRRKRDAMLAALEKHLSGLRTRHPGLTWTHPHGGLYVWLTLPVSVDTSRKGPLYPRCVEAGVLYVPGVYCFHANPGVGRCPSHHVRLSFGQVPPDDIEPGIERLAGAVRAVLG